MKAAFICAGIVSVHSKLSLSEQLLCTFGGGFELHTWSELPHGSGLGEQALSPCCSPTPFPLSALPPILSPASAQWRGRGWGRIGRGRAVSWLVLSSVPCRHQQHPGGGCPGRLAAGRRPGGGHGGPDPRSAASGAGAYHRYGLPQGRGRSLELFQGPPGASLDLQTELCCSLQWLELPSYHSDTLPLVVFKMKYFYLKELDVGAPTKC